MIRKHRTVGAALITVVVSLLLFAGDASASFYSNQTVAQVQIDNRACTFFWVNGISEADPAVPGAQWFALPKTAVNYQEMESEIVSVKLASRPVFVGTDGSISCGYATAVIMGLDH